MPKRSSDTLSKKQGANILRGMLYTAIYIPVLVVTYAFWVMAALSLCGISGCSGGGFGVVYNPGSVLSTLLWSGVITSIAPFIIFLISKFKWWWIVVTFATLIIVPLIGAAFIGAGLDGYPLGHVK